MSRLLNFEEPKKEKKDMVDYMGIAKDHDGAIRNLAERLVELTERVNELETEIKELKEKQE